MMLARFIDSLVWLIPPARVAAQAAATEVKVRIAPNDFGSLSLYPANAEALRVLGGSAPTGKFPTHADARRRLAQNCWTLVA